jgi:ribonuclease P protein component
MLKRIYRITKDKEFQAIYRRGRFQSTALFSINYLPAKRDLSRIGIVVSKKITKKATERNLIKRRVREIARELHPRLKGNFDIIISVKKPVAEADFQEMKNTITKMFEKADLI